MYIKSLLNRKLRFNLREVTSSVFFISEIFLPLAYFSEIWTQKKHYYRQKFIHFDHFSSI
jgi:hypothetical protein